MPDVQNDKASDEFQPAFDELMQNMTRLNESLSEAAAGALRMQMLALEDAQNMIAEIGAALAAASSVRDDQGGA